MSVTEIGGKVFEVKEMKNKLTVCKEQRKGESNVELEHRRKERERGGSEEEQEEEGRTKGKTSHPVKQPVRYFTCLYG